MPTVRLTDRLLRNLKTEKEQEDFWDEIFPGTFGVRVTDRGSKTFILRYRFGGRRRRFTLGRYQVLSLATARRMALALLGEANEGEDPSEKRQQEKNAGTFEELAQLYLEMHARPHKKPASIKEDTRILNTYLLPAWGRRKFQSITRSDVIRLLDEVKFKRKAPVMANRVKALVSTIFNFAARKALVPETFANPCANVEQPTKEKSRDRVLSDDEIRALWEDLENRAEPTASIYRLILLTGQRPGEVKAMRWSSIDSENIWTIPPTETKNEREHKVPLSSHALAVIEQLRPLTGDGEFVFAAPGGGHIRWLQKMSLRIQKQTGFNFRPHDLRRTCATNLSKLGVDDVTIARILNHSWPLRHMTAVYNRWERLPEMGRALERWGTQVERIVTGKSATKVATFKR
ncbi:site-specific integrase [Acidobacteria bacterium AH-259-G07]|nr:site-specific integrase [Acidobacteria bacterium AH-259-G07]